MKGRNRLTSFGAVLQASLLGIQGGAKVRLDPQPWGSRMREKRNPGGCVQPQVGQLEERVGTVFRRGVPSHPRSQVGVEPG